MGDFLAMGGYAAYVWSAFGLTLLLLGLLLWQSWHQGRKRARELAVLEAAAGGRRRGRPKARLTRIAGAAPDETTTTTA
ncbi:MAG: heme exporter protein CcmD [Geminicoccaceae bacterium]|nr:heme exporter protein CcmD [Geminicoccaceae bacterium]